MSAVSKLQSILVMIALSLSWIGAPGAAHSSAPGALPFTQEEVAPPDEADMQAGLQNIVNQELQEIRAKGFISVSEDEVNSFMLAQLAPWFMDAGNLAQRMPITYGFSRSAPPLKFVGMIGVPAPMEPDRYYSVVRVYTLPADITVTLEETDFASIGATVSHVKEMINVEISGYPGTVTYRRADAHKGLIMISWITQSRLLKLALAGPNVGPKQQAIALQLARAVK